MNEQEKDKLLAIYHNRESKSVYRTGETVHRYPAIRITEEAYVHIKDVVNRSETSITQIASRAIVQFCTHIDDKGYNQAGIKIRKKGDFSETE